MHEKQQNSLKIHRITNNNAIAALDLGSNSFHCLIVKANNINEVLAHGREPIQLRGGINSQTGEVCELTSQRAICALERFRDLLKQYAVKNLKIVGTQAFRLLHTECAFLKNAESILGYPIEILSGQKEAWITYRGVVGPWPGEIHQEHVSLVLDIGGGSSEFVLGVNAQVFQSTSLSIGAVELMQRFTVTDFSAVFMNRLIQQCCLEMESHLTRFKKLHWDVVYIASGIIEALLAWIQLLGITRLDWDSLMRLKSQLIDKEIPDHHLITSDRRKILPYALAILIAIMKILSIDRIIPSPRSLRHGLLLDLMEP